MEFSMPLSILYLTLTSKLALFYKCLIKGMQDIQKASSCVIGTKMESYQIVYFLSDIQRKLSEFQKWKHCKQPTFMDLIANRLYQYYFLSTAFQLSFYSKKLQKGFGSLTQLRYKGSHMHQGDSSKLFNLLTAFQKASLQNHNETVQFLKKYHKQAEVYAKITSNFWTLKPLSKTEFSKQLFRLKYLIMQASDQSWIHMD